MFAPIAKSKNAETKVQQMDVARNDKKVSYRQKSKKVKV
jgi:hypothetical protein